MVGFCLRLCPHSSPLLSSSLPQFLSLLDLCLVFMAFTSLLISHQMFARSLALFPVSSGFVPSFNGVSLFCTLQLAKQKGMLNWFWVSVFSSFLILHYTLPVSFLNSCPFWVCALFLAIQALTSPSSIFSFPFGFSPLLAIRIWSLLFDFGSLNLVLMVNIEW